jgi:hypothetical protein
MGSALLTPVCAQPAPPLDLEVRRGDRSVILHWLPSDGSDVKGYKIYRSAGSSGVFAPVLPVAIGQTHYTDFGVQNDSTYRYVVHAVDTDDLESEASNEVSVTPQTLSDEDFVELVAHTAFDYFWYEANPANGLVRDRSRPGSRSSIAAVGFGLTAVAVGAERGWITRDQARERVKTTLEFLWNSHQGPEADATGYKGFYYHFLDMETGRRAGTTELSTIDTALLLAGVVFVGQYFTEDVPDESRIRSLADSIYARVDWDWARVKQAGRNPAISHGWRPESGYIQYDWKGYNEAMILYILAMGSPTQPLNDRAWVGWTSGYGDNWGSSYGFTFLRFPPLFGHQYSHVWIDFRGIRDEYMRGKGLDYFENSRRATLANRAYCMSNPRGWPGYGENGWGLTASDGPDGYRARGAPPAQNDDGTLTPTAAGGSFAFTPNESLAALRHFYDTYRTRLWGYYGFRDAFNVYRDWFGRDFLGIDQGPIMLMIENQRTGLIWDVFMRSPDIQRGLEVAGFRPVSTDIESSSPRRGETGNTITITPEVFPNPSRGQISIRYVLNHVAEIQIEMIDALGRRVAHWHSGYQSTGTHVETLQFLDLASGLYVIRLLDGRQIHSRTFVITD